MNIKEAKQQVQDTVRAYLATDELGQPRIPVSKQRPLFLVGAPGIGKTAIMAQVAQEMGIGLVSYSMTHHTRQSALGLPRIVHRTYGDEEFDASEYTLSEIVASVYDFMERTGLGRGILFLDEINCVSETLYPSMLQFLQFKTFGTHRIPDDWVVVCAGNPPEYNKSVHEFDIVTLDRLRKVAIEPDLPAWREYAANAGVHPAILAFLDVKGSRFYAVESTPEGKTFVTARGWEDLSNTMKVFEEMGIPVDQQLVEQFIQKPDIAEDFALFYELFTKYQSDYQVDSILSGQATDEIRERARAAAFDERVALVGLLLDSISEACHEVLVLEACVTCVRDELRAAKGPLCEGAAVEDTVLAAVAQREADLAQKRASGVLGADEEQAQRRAIKWLREACQQCAREKAESGETAFAVLQEAYRHLVAQLEADVKAVQASLDAAFAFLDDVFSAQREGMVFVTELTARHATAQFITRFGSSSYYEHNEGLMVGENQQALFNRIDDLLNNLS